MRARCTSDSASENIQSRSFELAVLKQKLKNTRLFVLTGPKEVGKSFLVRKMAETDGTVIYIDLKAKSTVSEMKEALFDFQVRKVETFYVYTPTVLVIDEAQTMKVLGQADRDAFFEFVSSVTRDGKMAVLFVTSDFESLRELIGMRCDE